MGRRLEKRCGLFSTGPRHRVMNHTAQLRVGSRPSLKRAATKSAATGRGRPALHFSLRLAPESKKDCERALSMVAHNAHLRMKRLPPFYKQVRAPRDNASREVSRTPPRRAKSRHDFFETLSDLFDFALERVLRAVARLGKIAVLAVLHGIGVAVAELGAHGVVTGLGAFVGLLGAFSAVGIVVEMVADTFWHNRPFEMRVSTTNDYSARLR